MWRFHTYSIINHKKITKTQPYSKEGVHHQKTSKNIHQLNEF